MARAAEQVDVKWAQRIVQTYEAGGRVPEISKQAAQEVLGIRAGTLVRRGKQPAFDRMKVMAGDRDDE